MVIIYGYYIFIWYHNEKGVVMETIKSTIYINKSNKNELERLVSLNYLDSITEGINKAIEEYIKNVKKELYLKEMQEAGKDKDYLKRTLESQNDFNDVDKFEDDK